MENRIEEEEVDEEETPTILNETANKNVAITGKNCNRPFRTFLDTSESVLENGRLWDAVILTVVFRLIDLLFLLNTAVLWIKYSDNNKDFYYLLTLVFYAVPAALISLISVGRAISCLRKCRNGLAQEPPFLIELALYIIFGPHVGAFTKWRTTSKMVSRSLREKQRVMIIHLADEVTTYYITTNFIQSTTQFFLQFYIFSQRENENYTNARQMEILQGCQLIWSLLSLALAMTAWEESLIRINWRILLITFFWKLFSISSRMLSLSFCLIVSLPGFMGIFAGHWLLFTLLIAFRVKGVFPRNLYLSPVLALVYFINDLNLNYKGSLPHRLFFYVLSFIEGVVMMSVWIMYANRTIWQNYWLSVFVYLLFFIGIFFLRFKHECDYSKLRHGPYSQSRPMEKRLKFYVFNSCLGYPDYDKVKYVELEDE